MKDAFIFDIVVVDEMGTATTPTTYCRHSGIGLCESLADAAKQLEDEWDDLVSIKHLELLDTGSFIMLSWDVLNDIIQDKYWEGIPCDGMGEKI